MDFHSLTKAPLLKLVSAQSSMSFIMADLHAECLTLSTIRASVAVMLYYSLEERACMMEYIATITCYVSNFVPTNLLHGREQETRWSIYIWNEF